jgi:hypothetical protein
LSHHSKTRLILTALVAVLTVGAAEAGFRTPESLVRNIYAYYGDSSPGLGGGLPHDEETARQFFDRDLRNTWQSATSPPYDFFVQATAWKLGPVSIKVTRRQFDKTYVEVTVINNARPLSLNIIAVNSPAGWVILDAETPHDSLRQFLAQLKK